MIKLLAIAIQSITLLNAQELPPLLSVADVSLSQNQREQSRSLPSIHDVVEAINYQCNSRARYIYIDLIFSVLNLSIPPAVKDVLIVANDTLYNQYLTGTMYVLPDRCNDYLLIYRSLFNDMISYYAGLKRPLYHVLQLQSSLRNVNQNPSDTVSVSPEYPQLVIENPQRSQGQFFTEEQLNYIRQHPNNTEEAIYNEFLRSKKEGLKLTAEQKSLRAREVRAMHFYQAIQEVRAEGPIPQK